MPLQASSTAKIDRQTIEISKIMNTPFLGIIIPEG
jgi:hypothetical protein